MIDDFAHCLTPSEMLALAKTPEGAVKLTEYVKRGRAAYATQTILELMLSNGVISELPTPEIMQTMCEAIYNRAYQCSLFEVMAYAKEVAEGLQQTDLDCAGNA